MIYPHFFLYILCYSLASGVTITKNPSVLPHDPSFVHHIGHMEKERVINTCQSLTILHHLPKMYLMCHQRESGSILLCLILNF